MTNNQTLLVVGCQRSGTMLASKIFADYFDAHWLDEFDVLPLKRGAWGLEALYRGGLTNLVVQCPCAIQYWELFYTAVPNIKFVFIHRDKEDILNSMKRIEWLKDDHPNDWEEFLSKHIDNMYLYWEHLKERVPEEFWKEMHYNDFKDHPFFIPKEERTNFTVKQWNKDEPCDFKTWSKETECLTQELKKRNPGINLDKLGKRPIKK